MFTGKLVGISRAEAKSLVENNSGKIISNVSKKLDFLVTGEKPTARKINEAKNLDIKIISQSEFLKMLNIKGSWLAIFSHLVTNILIFSSKLISGN